jgi:hypothetical protein
MPGFHSTNMISIISHIPPAIAKLPSGTYAVPSWTKVPDGTTLENITWVRSQPSVKPPEKVRTIQVKSYTLTIYGASGKVTCTCPGYTYRRKCKHVDMHKAGTM